MRDLIGLQALLLLQPGVCDRDRAFGKMPKLIKEVHRGGVDRFVRVTVTIVTQNASSAHNGGFGLTVSL